MIWRIEPLPDDGPRFEGAVAVYAEAFAEPPYRDANRGTEIRRRLQQQHRRIEGYRGFVALGRAGLPGLPDHGVAGMTYGYRSLRDQWWRDTVARQLDRKARERWLDDAYELVEIAVHPALQGRGVGALLVGALLAGRAEATCVLSTRTDSRAHRLYARLGFEVITEMPFGPGGPPFYVMGKRLR